VGHLGETIYVVPGGFSNPPGGRTEIIPVAPTGLLSYKYAIQRIGDGVPHTTARAGLMTPAACDFATVGSFR